MTERLEDRLSRVLTDRARTIHSAPGYRLVPDEAPNLRRNDHDRKRAERRVVWSLIASATAVAALAALVVVLLNGELGDQRSAPTLKGANCVLTHSSRFTAALHNGRLPAGTRLLSSDPDGTALVSIDHRGTTSAVELLDRNGEVEQLWTAGAGERGWAVANPSGAITADAVAFVLDPPGSAPARVIVASRPDDVALPAPGPAPGYRFATDPLVAPVIVSDGIVVALETSTAHPTEQRVDSYWPPDGRWTATARVSGAARLLSVGGNVVVLRGGADGTAKDVEFADAQYRPSTLRPAVRNGYAFSSDGTTMTWLSRQSGRPALLRWAPGDPSPIRDALPPDLTPVSAAGRYVVEASGRARGIVDTADGAVVQLPTGVDLLRVDGPVAVLTEQTSDGVRYSRVPTSVLTAC